MQSELKIRELILCTNQGRGRKGILISFIGDGVAGRVAATSLIAAACCRRCPAAAGTDGRAVHTDAVNTGVFGIAVVGIDH